MCSVVWTRRAVHFRTSRCRLNLYDIFPQLYPTSCNTSQQHGARLVPIHEQPPQRRSYVQLLGRDDRHLVCPWPDRLLFKPSKAIVAQPNGQMLNLQGKSNCCNRSPEYDVVVWSGGMLVPTPVDQRLAHVGLRI